MITPIDIFERVKELVAEEFPGEKIYEDLVPEGFERPSTMIALAGVTADVAAGCNAVEILTTLQLVTHVETDKYHHSHLAALHLRQMRLLKLLLPGYITVGDRAPKVRGKIDLAGGYDYDTVKVTFAHTLSREDFMNIPQLPLMEHLHINEEVIT